VAARRAFPESETAFAAVAEYLAEAMLRLSGGRAAKKRAVEIPISFAEEDALDLPDILRAKRLSKTEFIDIFTAWTYRVFMVGFLPGFAYMGEVDERIATPRRQTPRTKVPQGSVGIAGSQTGIYPFDSPGGWQIVGRTRLEMFLLEREPNCLLQAGDEVRFVVKKV
jgi:inhibitor of KinA